MHLNVERKFIAHTNEVIIIRIDVEQISMLSRVTQGVRLIMLKDDQYVSSVALIDKTVENENDENIKNGNNEISVEN